MTTELYLANSGTARAVFERDVLTVTFPAGMSAPDADNMFAEIADDLAGRPMLPESGIVNKQGQRVLTLTV